MSAPDPKLVFVPATSTFPQSASTNIIVVRAEDADTLYNLACEWSWARGDFEGVLWSNAPPPPPVGGDDAEEVAEFDPHPVVSALEPGGAAIFSCAQAPRRVQACMCAAEAVDSPIIIVVRTRRTPDGRDSVALTLEEATEDKSPSDTSTHGLAAASALLADFLNGGSSVAARIREQGLFIATPDVASRATGLIWLESLEAWANFYDCGTIRVMCEGLRVVVTGKGHARYAGAFGANAATALATRMHALLLTDELYPARADAPVILSADVSASEVAASVVQTYADKATATGIPTRPPAVGASQPPRVVLLLPGPAEQVEAELAALHAKWELAIIVGRTRVAVLA